MSLVLNVDPLRKPGFLENMVRRIAEAQLQRARRRLRIWSDRRHLEQLPDYMLRDIGISRSEIATAIEHGRDTDRWR